MDTAQLSKTKKFHKVMKEFSNHLLKTHGRIVTNLKQAEAIAFSEARHFPRK